MGKIFGLIVILILALVGYVIFSAKPAPKEQTLEGYAGALQIAEKKAEDASALFNSRQIQQSVERYRAEKGQIPSSLEEMVAAGFLDHVPGNVQYDPATGTVSTKP